MLRPDLTNRTRRSWIENAYKNALGREVDAGGLAHWYQTSLGNQAAIENALRSSSEGKKYSIRKLYEEKLGRTPSDREINDWLGTGRSVDQISKGISNSAEGRKYAEGLAVNATLMQDPAYAAYMRKMNADQAALENRRIADEDRQRNMEGVQYAQYDYNQKNDLKDIANRYGGRGTFRSSVRQWDQGRKTSEYDQQRDRYALDMSQKSADRQAQYSNEFGDLSRKRDEFEIEARNNLFNRDAKGYYNG